MIAGCYLKEQRPGDGLKSNAPWQKCMHVRFPMLCLQFTLTLFFLPKSQNIRIFYSSQSSFECTDAVHLKLCVHCLDIMPTYSLKLLSVK